jgi:hypothetical protein
MTYLTTASVLEVSKNTSPADVTVSWEFGNQVPDIVDVHYRRTDQVRPTLFGEEDWEVGESAPEVRIDPRTGTPTKTTFQVAAPETYVFDIAPRLTDANGRLQKKMPDDFGVDRDWWNFVIQLQYHVVGAPVGSSSTGPPPKPQITNVAVTKGRFRVDWTVARKPDHFNINVGAPSDKRDQDEVDGHWTSYTVELTEPALYQFGIQACNKSWPFRSSCSEWEQTEVVAQTWQTSDIDVRPDAHFALGLQGSTTLDLFVADPREAVFMARSPGGWRGWLDVTRPGTVPAGAPLATVRQPGIDQLDLLFITNGGRLAVTWVVGLASWQGVALVGNTRFAPPGAHLAVAGQPPDDRLTALVVGDNEALYVAWWEPDHPWHDPVPLSPPKIAPAGAPVRAARRRLEAKDVAVPRANLARYDMAVGITP